MNSSYDIIKLLLHTEKGAFLQPDNKYIFWVDSRTNKIQVRRAVEDIYKVKVISVNMLNMKGKPKRVRHQLGTTRAWKKAVVTLAENNKIELA